uniref:Putative sorbin and sh3 domain-containing protein n=1 Tax=Tabanus bromius TaxID=304241 RepID=A0A0K8TM41_TABBR
MTIPSRPAPPPPTQQRQNAGAAPNLVVKLPPPPTSAANGRDRVPTPKPSSITRKFPSARTRYAPVTNWDDQPFGAEAANKAAYKKVPPPRPPPPKVLLTNGSNYESSVLKKPGGPPQSVNVLSSFFGKKKPPLAKKPTQKLPPFTLPVVSSNQTNQFSLGSYQPQSQSNKEGLLISFDSPPSSPTFTQKSNSDCVSVDSFSSDSNFSSPHNGSISQTESGFEDDFTSPTDPFESIRTEPMYDNASKAINDYQTTAPIRNISAINRISNDNPLCNGKTLLPPPPALVAPTIIKPKSVQNSTVKPKLELYALPPCEFDLPEVDFEVDDTPPSPPMPSCPPPPPPPQVEDVNNFNLDAINLSEEPDWNEPSYGIALYDFEGVEVEDLSFKVNEKIYILEQLSDDWLRGRNKRGCEGIFPRNYIQIKVPLKNITIAEESNKVRVLYNFNAEVADDLTIRENQIVTVLHKINDDWLYGEIDGRRGQFPANFIEYVPKNLPLA